MLLLCVNWYEESRETVFQWAPTLGGECYNRRNPEPRDRSETGFNGHPPLGVNATASIVYLICTARLGFNGHPPLGVNATWRLVEIIASLHEVSMGTHPWG